jgi:uncharacterized protein
MNNEERQMLQGLFDRLRDSSNQPRDPEAERFIADQIRYQPGSTYYMAQAVIVQEQALQDSQSRIAELEDRVRQLEGAGQARSAQGNFLAGRTGGMFSRGAPEPARPATSVPASGPWGNRGPSMVQPQAQAQQGYAQPMQAPPPQQQASGGGGFLKGAIATAAGVAGGALIYDQMKGMFGGNSGQAQASSSQQANQAEVNRTLDEVQDEQLAEDNAADQQIDQDSGGDTEI